MTVIHFVYPHGNRISTPDAIGREVGLRLREHYEVIHYDWNELGVIKPHPDAVLLGHAHPAPWTIFRQSARLQGWKRKLLLSPFHHGDITQVAFSDHVLPNVDFYLAITGNYWFDTIRQSAVSHWLPKMIHVDLAVNRSDFPVTKHAFNPAGKRRFLYIGGDHKAKNLAWLNEIAQALPEFEFAWVGSSESEFSHLKPLGFHDFSKAESRELVAQYDFLITVGKADANPTTILEAMAWGLIPVCTVQSGYKDYPGIINVRLNDTVNAVEMLRELQKLPEQQVLELQVKNSKVLDEHFNWDRFARQVKEAVESEESPALGVKTAVDTATLRFAEINSLFMHQNMLKEIGRTGVRKYLHWNPRNAHN